MIAIVSMSLGLLLIEALMISAAIRGQDLLFAAGGCAALTSMLGSMALVFFC
jgi:hypothetical protein